MRLYEFIDETAIKLSGSSDKAKAWIKKVYDLYPQTWQNNHVMPLGGQGDDQQFAMFELEPSFSKRGAVEIKWFQAYPLRQGVGSRAMKELQRMAQEDGIALTLYPWDKGQVSQSKLTKFYKGQGFNPTVKGAKNLAWNPVEEGREEALHFATQAHAGQTRAGGAPYISHPVRVAQHVEQWKKSHNIEALISAAYLHDTLEDTDTTHEALHDLFGGLVASLVQELTSDPEEIKKVGKAAYLAHKMAAMSSYALVIKLADRLDNVKDITTAKTPEWRTKYKAETEHILDYIEKNRALSGTHQKLIELIRNKLQELQSVDKNFDDGKNPGRKGLSQRMGIPKHATISQLEKHAKAPAKKEEWLAGN